MTEPREKLVEQALSSMESRYMVCSLISKRANQIVKHQDSQGVAWAINKALEELNEGKIRYQSPTPPPPPPMPARGKSKSRQATR